jgi:hypothetical protein
MVTRFVTSPPTDNCPQGGRATRGHRRRSRNSRRRSLRHLQVRAIATVGCRGRGRSAVARHRVFTRNAEFLQESPLVAWIFTQRISTIAPPRALWCVSAGWDTAHDSWVQEGVLVRGLGCDGETAASRILYPTDCGETRTLASGL